MNSTRQPIDPQTPTPHDGPQPRVIPYSAKWQRYKTVGRGCSCLFSLIVIILSSVMRVYHSTYATGLKVFGNTVAAACILWNVAELVTAYVRSGRSLNRGIHPGAHVGLDLVLFLGLAFLCSFMSALAYYDDNGLDYVRFESEQEEQGWKIHARVIVAALVFLALLAIVHFALFVRACVEVHQRNSVIKEQAVFLVPYKETKTALAGERTSNV